MIEWSLVRTYSRMGGKDFIHRMRGRKKGIASLSTRAAMVTTVKMEEKEVEIFCDENANANAKDDPKSKGIVSECKCPSNNLKFVVWLSF
jgi:hypothetical protein